LNNFAGVPSLLIASNLICMLPAGVVRTHSLRKKIYVCDVPLQIAPFECQMAWHTRNERDPAHRWMRELVVQACGRIWKERE
jgi:DNA-binding transcriptional LysR family regulator